LNISNPHKMVITKSKFSFFIVSPIAFFPVSVYPI